MRVNVDKVLERDQKLSELDDRAGNVQIHQIYALSGIIINNFILQIALLMFHAIENSIFMRLSIE